MITDLTATLQSHSQLLFLGAVFLTVTLLIYAIANVTRSWTDVRRRAGAQTSPAAGMGGGGDALLVDRQASGSFLDLLLPKKESEKGELRRLMNLAGFRGAMAPALLQISRIISAIVLGFLTAANFNTVLPDKPYFMYVGLTLLMALGGYLLPKTLVSLRRDALIEEHRQGFPDFLDLLVICIEAGIGIDSAIERVSRDMQINYPSLSFNLMAMSLEMRAGRSMRDALENLAARLGIEEAKSFATLLQQSEELGSSLVQSLRVYGNEMREKRLSRAEEKANALPAKLVIPLGLFIFPVILAVVLTPVVLKIYKALGI